MQVIVIEAILCASDSYRSCDYVLVVVIEAISCTSDSY